MWLLLPPVQKGASSKAATLPFAPPATDERQRIQRPGSRGGHYYLDKQGQVVYGERPTGAHEAQWDDAPETHRAQKEAFEHRVGAMAPEGGAVLATPNKAENKGSGAAAHSRAQLRSPAHARWLEQVRAIDAEIGVEGEDHAVIGDSEQWSTEDSLLTTYRDIPPQALAYIAARRGQLTDQDATIAIAYAKAGPDYHFEVEMPGAVAAEEVKAELVRRGFQGWSVEENGHTTVHLLAFGDTRDTLAHAALDYVQEHRATARVHRGTVSFVERADYAQLIEQGAGDLGGGTAQAARRGGRDRGGRGGSPERRAEGQKSFVQLRLGRLIVKGFRHPVEHPGARGATKWFRNIHGVVVYGERPSARVPKAAPPPKAPRMAAATPPPAPERETSPAPASKRGTRREQKPAARRTAPAPKPRAAVHHLQEGPPLESKAPKATPPPVTAAPEPTRVEKLGEVALPDFTKIAPNEEHAHLAMVALLKTGILEEAQRGKQKGRLMLNVKEANDLRFSTTQDPQERSLRYVLEGLRRYATDPVKPSSPEISASFGRVYHQGGRVDQPLMQVTNDVKIGQMLAHLIEGVNSGAVGTGAFASLAKQKTPVTSETVKEVAARAHELRAKAATLIAAKHQEILPGGERVDHSTWQPPPTIRVAGDPKLKARPWQGGEVEWALAAKRGVNALDVGLGKTGASIMHLAALKARGEADQGIVMAEVNQVGGWEEDFKTWWPDVKVAVLDDPKTVDAKLATKPDVVVMSYGPLTTENNALLEKLTKGKRTSWYFDEARALRDPLTNSYRTLKPYLAKDQEAVAAQLLTGTPTPNRPDEAFAMVDLLFPGMLGTPKSFQRRYTKTVKVGDTRETVYTNLDQLRQALEPYVYTKSRYDADARGMMTDLAHVHRPVAMQPEQQVEYQAAASGTLATLAGVDNPDKLSRPDRQNFLAAITRMRQAAFDPASYNPNYKGSAAAVDATIEHIQHSLEHDPAHGIVAFAEHVASFPRIAKLIAERTGLHEDQIGMVTGAQSADERSKLRRELNEGKLKVLLAGYKAAGQGMNLQKNATQVITMQDPWTAAMKDQAIARVYRQGQKNPVTHVGIDVPGTITEHVAEVVGKKRKLGEALWGAKEPEAKVHSMTYADFVKISGFTMEEVNAARRKAGKQPLKVPT